MKYAAARNNECHNSWEVQDDGSHVLIQEVWQPTVEVKEQIKSQLDSSLLIDCWYRETEGLVGVAAIDNSGDILRYSFREIDGNYKYDPAYDSFQITLH